MLKKILTSSILFIASISCAHAGFYIGPLVAYDSITSDDMSYFDINPRLTLGFGQPIEDTVYIAGELFAGPKSFTLKNDTAPEGSLKTTYSYGASIIPGYYLDAVVLAYARLGVIETHFDNPDTTRIGYQAGIGLQAQITEKWDIRGEYTHTSYVTVDDLGKPKAGQYAVGLVYHIT